MSSAWKVLASGLVLTAAAIATAADPPPSKEQIAQWVRDLGSDSFAARDRASRMLWSAGRAAEDALAEAARSDDAEVRRRAGDLLEKFKWGIYPDTPAEVVELIRRYQGGPAEERQKVIKDLFDRGAKGCAALVKIARAEQDAELRQQLFLQISQEASRAVPQLLADDNFATLDELTELSLSVRAENPILQNYAAYWLLRGKLDERIAEQKARAERNDDAVARQALAFLYRARGDRDELRKVAEKAGRLDVLQAVLAEAGDWKALSRLAEKDDGSADAETLGLRAAYHRLAGNAVAFDGALVELRKLADDSAGGDPVWGPCKALLLNAGPGEVIERLAKTEKAPLAFDVLVAQLKVKEALEFADRSVERDRETAIILRLHKARALGLLGETEKAKEIFDDYGETLERNRDVSWADDLIKNEYRGGFRDKALEHLALVLAGPRGQGSEAGLLGSVYREQRERAVVWWKLLRQCRPDDKPAESLALLDRLLAGKVGGDELRTLLDDAAPRARNLPPPEREAWLLALGETALEAGLDDAGRGHLEQAALAGVSPAGFLKLGDHFAEKKQWEKAAEAYGQAQERDPSQPLPAWLRGWALQQAGRAAEGKKLMELAHWLPLGNEEVRHAFCKELLRRQNPEAREALRREVELAERTGQPNSYHAGELLRLAAAVAVEKKDYLRAADLQERALLRVLSPFTEFIENPAYVSVPHYIHALRARGLLAAGRVADARREIDYCQGLLPGNVDLAIGVAPELDRRGEKKLADEVFAKALAANEKVCTEYPRSAGHHNNLAWLCASCRRELDKGLEHASAAVKLAPEHAGYLDTLAEIHFQRGDQAKAVALMKKCVEMDPKRPYYRKQLKRIEAGDRNAEVPAANDDEG